MATLLALSATLLAPSVALAQSCADATITDGNQLNDIIARFNTECGSGDQLIATINSDVLLQGPTTPIDNSTDATLELTGGGTLIGIAEWQILDIDNGNVVIDRLTFIDGQAPSGAPTGAAIDNDGTLTIRESTLQNNGAGATNGGAIYNVGTLTVERSTFQENQADANGGAIYNDSAGTAEIANSTFYANRILSGNGAAIYNAGVMTITNATVARQAGPSDAAALYHAASDVTDTRIRNSIVARNQTRDCGGADSPAFTAVDANLDTDTTCTGFTLQEASPLFDDPPADNGGPTNTLALQDGSDAIDAATDCPPPNADQRGVERPDGLACDLGAYETAFEASPPSQPDLIATKSNDTGGSGNVGSTFQWRITVRNDGEASATFDEATGTDPEEIDSPRFLTDALPTGADYGSLTIDDSGVASGSARCEKQVFDGVTLIRCAADGSITFDPGDAFAVAIEVTPTATGELANPLEREGAICAVDPQGAVSESDETNNNCSDVVTVESEDSDDDGIPDGEEGDGDRDDDGVPNFEDFDPAGYFYCRDTGEIVEGGSISVSGPAPANIRNDGSSGRYDFTVDTPGTYTVVFNPPPNTSIDASFEQTVAFDPTGRPDPVVLGPGEDADTGVLADEPEPFPTDYYSTFELEPDDPEIINNNVPLFGPACAEEEASVGGDPPLWGDTLVFPTPERYLGRDLNGDADTQDAVLRIKHVDTGRVRNTGIPVSNHHRAVDLHEGTAVFVTQDSGLTDPSGLFTLWGTTRTDEGPIGVLDVETGEVTMLDVWGTRPTIHENVVTVSGSTLRYYDLADDRLVDTRHPGTRPAVWGEWIVYERSTNGVPRLQLYHLPTGGTQNTGVAGAYPAIHEGTVAFTTEESWLGDDLNGDGDASDTVVRAYDIADDRIVSTRQAGQNPAIYGDRIAFSQGRSILYHDLSTGRTYDTGQQGAEPDIFQGTITSYVWEDWLGADRSLDGDREDPIVRTHAISKADRVLAQPELPTTPEREPLTLRHVHAHRQADGVRFAVKGQGIDEAAVSVFDLSGRRVARKRSDGAQLTWRLTRDDGRRVANGVYLYVATIQGAEGKTLRSEVRKLVVLR